VSSTITQGSFYITYTAGTSSTCSGSVNSAQGYVIGSCWAGQSITSCSTLSNGAVQLNGKICVDSAGCSQKCQYSTFAVPKCFAGSICGYVATCSASSTAWTEVPNCDYHTETYYNDPYCTGTIDNWATYPSPSCSANDNVACFSYENSGQSDKGFCDL
jgi:hypothetical protein